MLYFDFISFAQMATIDGYVPSAERADEIFAGTGERILAALREGEGAPPAGGAAPAAPVPTAPRGAEDVLGGAEALLAVLVEKGYASGASVVPVDRAAEGELVFVSTLLEPATLWGAAELVAPEAGRRVCGVRTLYENMLVAAWLREGPFAPAGARRPWLRTSSIINLDQRTVQCVWKLAVGGVQQAL